MKEKLNILLLGRGGRESALAAKLLQSPRTATLHTAPASMPGAVHAQIPVDDFDAIEAYIQLHDIDLVIPGNEKAIVAGIFDWMEESGVDVKVIGPNRECAQLEGSKEYAKEFMCRHAIPTARFMPANEDTLEEGFNFLESLEPPYVLKADGMAEGKGVFIIEHLDEAKHMLEDMIQGMFGASSQTVIIEEFMRGREVSMFVAVDGQDYTILGTAHDYKRLHEGNTGLNTAGMGAISPASYLDSDFLDKIERRILQPTLRGMQEEGMDYRGILYLGVIEVEGHPVLLEYNVRMGDPEAQVLLPRMESDLVDLMEGIADRTLAIKRVQLSNLFAVGIVLAAEGYPLTVKRGDLIEGISDARKAGAIVYPGAMSIDEEGRALTDGGRVLTVVALGTHLEEACINAHRAASLITFPGLQKRDDIGRLCRSI